MRDLFIRTGTVVVCLFAFATLGLSQSTPEQLIGSVLKGLEAKDRQALKGLAISEADVKKLVWPIVVSNMVGGNMNADKFSSSYMKTSDIGVDKDLEEKTVRLLGGVLEQGGTFNVATYYVSPTQK